MTNSTFADHYCQRGETQAAALHRVAGTLATDDAHFVALKALLDSKRFWPSGRILANAGSIKVASPVAAFASGPIEDSLASISQRAAEAAETMRQTGSMSYDVTPLRPEGAAIGRGAGSAGPVGFIRIFDAYGHVIQSAGKRDVVQLAALRVDHPDIENFIHAKFGTVRTAVAITDAFMQAAIERRNYELTWNGRLYGIAPAEPVWEGLMRQIYTTGSPRLVFIDRINRLNPLNHAENITTVNPWLEQPLPPWGSCPLGTFDVSKYTSDEQLFPDIAVALEAYDNLIERTVYPIKEQGMVARASRRVGFGLMGMQTRFRDYDFPSYMAEVEAWLASLKAGAEEASKRLAEKRGAYPMAKTGALRRNSHLLSLAPTGTISQIAGVTPGIYRHGLTPSQQVELYTLAQQHIDGGVAATVTAPKTMPWQEFKQLTMGAWAAGAKSLHIVTE